MSDHGGPVSFLNEYRVFEYSCDEGKSWRIVVSTLRNDNVEQVTVDLTSRFKCEVMVREKMPGSASVSTAARCRSSKAARPRMTEGNSEAR